MCQLFQSHDHAKAQLAMTEIPNILLKRLTFKVIIDLVVFLNRMVKCKTELIHLKKKSTIIFTQHHIRVI